MKLFYESVQVRIEWFMGAYHVTMRARTVVAPGEYEWDDLYAGQFSSPDREDPLDDVYVVLDQVAQDIASERHLAMKEPGDPHGARLPR